VVRRLFLLNVLLGGAAFLSVALIARVFLTPPPPVPPRARPPEPAPETRVAELRRPPAGGYSVIATRNLFSPTRSEAPATATAASQVTFAKPSLFGVILRDNAPIAYLEDPTTKRVAGYRLGDAIAGGKVQKIAADHVIITRADGDMDVRLRDPSKPRPAAPPVAGAPRPGTIPTLPPVPGAVPPRVPLPGQVQAPQVPPSTLPFVPGGRPSPSLLRRMPIPRASDAPAPAPPQQ
jgi:hypothetical protein